MQNNVKIDAVVVLYNPDNSVIDNIKTYNNVDKIFVIDNSDILNDYVVKEIKKIENVIYINNNGNKGIAYALNLGAKLSLKNGADWLLTMDQDSKFEIGSLQIMIDYLKTISTIDVGIIAPFHYLTKGKNYKKSIINEKVLTTMTSGNSLNLKAYLKIGKFRDDYFIDYIDHEYCLRLNRNGFKIITLNNSILYHKLGNLSEYGILGIKKIYCTNHNAVRLYYRTRNRLDLYRNYFFYFPLFVLMDLKFFLKELLKILLFEDNKIKKIKMILKGIKDFMLGRFGEYVK